MSKQAENQRIYKAAHEAGMKALKAARPTPMVVGTPTTPLGNDIDYSKPVEVVEGGMCGFAWVLLTNGRCSFARWVVKNRKGRKSYYGGIRIPVHEGGQSIQRKEAYAGAFARVLNDVGIDAYADSRLD